MLGNAWRIRVYKDRTGKWRWRLQTPNGRIVGASTESYTHRKWALTNLFMCTGVSIVPGRGQRGDIWKRYTLLGHRTMIS